MSECEVFFKLAEKSLVGTKLAHSGPFNTKENEGII